MWIYFLIGASVTKAQTPFGGQAIFTLVLHKLGGNGKLHEGRAHSFIVHE